MTTRIRTFSSIGAWLLVLLLAPPASHAIWGVYGSAVANSQQTVQAALPDGDGGVFAAFDDYTGLDFDIYMQRLDANGDRAWAYPGVPVSVASGDQVWPEIVSDGAGGVLVAWADFRSTGAIYAQRLTADGTPLWAADGVPVIVGTANPNDLVMTSDGAGGAIICWTEWLTLNSDLLAQRFDETGSPLWVTNTVVCNATGYQQSPRVVTDDANGAIVVWYDQRVSPADGYAQRISAAGTPLWAANGNTLNSYTGGQTSSEAIPDGAGGAIVVWGEFHAATDVYAQRVDPAGALLWGATGVAVSAASLDQWYPVLATDGDGGAIFSWIDDRNGNRDIYVQRVGSLGNPRWTSDGVPISVDVNFQEYPQMASDGAGGAVVTWADWRNANQDVYAQRVDPDGVSVWPGDGAPVCSLGTSNQSPAAIVSDGSGSAVVLWHDAPGGAYAQRLEIRYGQTGRPDPWVRSVADVPGDQGGVVKVDWLASQHDRITVNDVTYYSVWRAIDEIPASAKKAGAIVTVSEIAADFKGPAYRVEHAAAGDFFWEWVGNQDAFQLPGYAYSAPTLYDSTAASPDPHFFQVIAHSWSGYHWPSSPRGGYSVDNLSPGAPLSLAAQRVGNDVDLEWSPADPGDPDFHHYAIYRSEGSGFPPDPAYFLSEAPDTMLTDTTADPAKPYYYLVVAVDLHFNESDPSNEAMADKVATGIEERTPAPTALQVLPNSPNPFSGSTRLRIGLPMDADVEIDVYDILGRRVYSRWVADVAAGWWTTTYDGRDGRGGVLPSGVYFFRVKAAGSTQTQKMVIAR